MNKAGSTRYSVYVIFILSLATCLNYYDRNLIGILIEPLKAELHFSDSQVGLLSGLAFAIVYCAMGIPIARFADRGRRVRVLGIALAFWSVMTSLTGFATNFATLFAARLGVGVGEAGGLPTTHALVSAYTTPRWRATALGATTVATGVGVALAAAIGGLIAQHYGWRAAFWTAGPPGLVVAILVLFTIREPEMPHRVDARASTFGEDARELLTRRSMLLLCIGLGAVSIGAYGTLAWTPSLLVRTYGLSLGEVGASYAAATAPLWLVGSLGGGLLSDQLSRRDPRWALWIIVGSFALNVPISLALFHASSFGVALIFAAISTMLSGIFTAPSFALIQNLSGARLRATGAAIFMAIGNLAGLGLGPYVTGLLSDLLAERFGTASLAIALSVVVMSYAVGVVIFLFAMRTLRADLIEADRT